MHSIEFVVWKDQKKLISISKANIDFIIWTKLTLKKESGLHIFLIQLKGKSLYWDDFVEFILKAVSSGIFNRWSFQLWDINISATYVCPIHLIRSINHINNRTDYWIYLIYKRHTIDPSSIESNPSTQTWNLTFVGFPVNNAFQYYSDNNFKKDILLIFIEEWLSLSFTAGFTKGWQPKLPSPTFSEPLLKILNACLP